MVLNKKEKKIFQIILYRKNMKTSMPREKLEFFWGRGFEHLLKESKKFENSKIIKRKIKLVKRNIKQLLFLDWVKFIAITGSVAAGLGKKEDDVDVFIVVKNNRMWLYRAILVLKLGIKSLRRVWGKPFKDKIDTNFICEERGLYFDTKSIFILHELLFMIPVYNKDYYEKILCINKKLLKCFEIEREESKVNKSKNYIFIFFNFIAFSIQYIYMLVRNHKPNLRRLLKNNKKGRIAFFPEDFRKKKISEYKKFCQQIKQV